MTLGPFFALGRGAVVSLLNAPALPVERQRLEQLRPGNPMFYDDQWFGSAMWRLVGGSIPLRLHALNPEWNRLFVDTNGFVVHPFLTIWHNRRKYLERMRILGAFARRFHCPMPVDWVLREPDCCNISGSRGGRRQGPQTWSVVEVQVASSATRREVDCKRITGLSGFVDLRDAAKLRELGLA